MLDMTLALIIEWIRPVGIGCVLFFAHLLTHDPVSLFHFIGPFTVMLMSGSVAFESLFIGEAASEKIGYAPNKAYQFQSGLSNAATAITAFLVFVLNWGTHAEATIVVVMLLFFLLFSGQPSNLSCCTEKPETGQSFASGHSNTPAWHSALSNDSGIES